MKSIKGIVFSYFAAVLVFSFIVLGGTTTILVYRLIRQTTIRDNTHALKALTSNIRRRYWNRLHLLDQLALNRDVQALDLPRARKASELFLTFSNLFSTVHFYNTKGDLLFAEANKNLRPYAKHRNYHDNPNPGFALLADQAISERKPLTSTTFYTRTGELYQVYVVPVFDHNDPDKLIGILSGGIFPRLMRYDDMLQGLTMSDRNFIFIADDRGNLLATNSGAARELPDQIRERMEQRCKQIAEENLTPNKNPEYALERGLAMHKHVTVELPPYVLVSEPLDDLNLSITLGINMETVRLRVLEILRGIGSVFIFCLVFGLLVSRAVGSRLVKSLHTLLEGAKEINRGNFDYPLSRTGNDEISELSRHLDDIRLKIKKDQILGDLWMENVDERDR